MLFFFPPCGATMRLSNALLPAHGSNSDMAVLMGHHAGSLFFCFPFSQSFSHLDMRVLYTKGECCGLLDPQMLAWIKLPASVVILPVQVICRQRCLFKILVIRFATLPLFFCVRLHQLPLIFASWHDYRCPFFTSEHPMPLACFWSCTVRSLFHFG